MRRRQWVKKCVSIGYAPVLVADLNVLKIISECILTKTKQNIPDLGTIISFW